MIRPRSLRKISSPTHLRAQNRRFPAKALSSSRTYPPVVPPDIAPTISRLHKRLIQFPPYLVRRSTRQARWNTNGTVLALSGTARAHLGKSGQSRELSVVKLYSPYGVLLRTLKVCLLFVCFGTTLWLVFLALRGGGGEGGVSRRLLGRDRSFFLCFVCLLFAETVLRCSRHRSFRRYRFCDFGGLAFRYYFEGKSEACHRFRDLP